MEAVINLSYATHSNLKDLFLMIMIVRRCGHPPTHDDRVRRNDPKRAWVPDGTEQEGKPLALKQDAQPHVLFP